MTPCLGTCFAHNENNKGMLVRYWASVGISDEVVLRALRTGNTW